MKEIKSTHKGFTLLETLVAVALLSISLAAPITVATQGLSSAFFAKDQVTAFYLAQEAVEYVRSVRDENFLKSQAWLTGLDTCISGTCAIDMPNHTHSSCTGGTCDPLNFDTDTQLYSNAEVGGSVEQSKFTRSVSIESINANEASITVTITWTTGSKTRTFSIRENIFNWL